ncbi:MAG: choice-of-anchor Q domain-containing protein [Methylococcales bacterium]
MDQEGVAISNGFRWQLEEDRTHHATAGTVGTQTNPPLALSFHTSHHPVATQGEINAANGSIDQPDPSKRYFLSVLPYEGYTLGGAVVPVGTTSGDSFTVVVSNTPIPTAQISVFLFEDNSPINGAPDLPLEQGINGSVEGFKILVEDAGGGYGVTAGTLQTDAFGNPLGTEYNADGSIRSIGDGSIPIDSNGVAHIRNLPPAKYGVQIIPPAGSDWVQTSTIEGSPVIDAWVQSNEPSFFVEFGPPGHHVFIGFVHKNTDETASLNEAAVSGPITGRITNNHLNRPPGFGANSGNPFPGCLVAINEDPLVGGRALFVEECDTDSKFSLPSLPAGSYMLSVWDTGLNIVIANSSLTVLADGNCINPKTPNDLLGGACELGDLPVFRWFGRYDSIVFFDTNEDGFRDPDEPGLNDLALNLRFRNGVIYQANATDFDGAFTFERVFPFFNWLVPEVDFGLGLKATGATIVVDAGGGTIPPAQGDVFGQVEDINEIDTHGQTLVPQPQICSPDDVAANIDNCGTDGVGSDHINPNTLDNLSRTETGPVLTMGMQTFLGQSNYIEWGKSTYGPGENGGVSGVIYYASTRAEDDPRFAAFEPWEPGIPRVVVNLYADGDTNKPPFGDPGTNGCPVGVNPAGTEDTDWDNNGCIDLDDNVIEDVNQNGSFDLADADNYPFDNFPGPEDINRTDLSDPGHGYSDAFDYGDAIQITSSDSWDDSQPTGCQGDIFTASTGVTTDCFDGLRNFNQIRPAVFDGGYAFDSYFPDGVGANLDNLGAVIEANVVSGLPASTYIVESITPTGHQLVREEDKNVDFGESFIPDPALLPAFCVGDDHTVPQYVSFQTDASDSNPLPGIPQGDLVEAPFMGDARPLCDRKKVSLADGQNAATDFAYFTQVPKAAHVVGVILNDLANEFDPNSPTFGEKAAPPFVPVSFRDSTGREIIRVYSDEFGAYNAMLPSSWTANVPSPSGYSPAMLTACMNDAGPIKDSNGNAVIDPFFNRQLSQFCYTFQFMPGATTILDTPVVPIAAFARNGQFPVDCEFPTKTPGIFSASRMGGNGPLVQPGDTLEIISAGQMQVPNPKYDGLNGTQPLKLTRDYGFGNATGLVTLTRISDSTEVNLDVGADSTPGSWSDGLISAEIPAGLEAGDYQLSVETSGAIQSETSVTVTVVDNVSSPGFDVQFVQPSTAQDATPIQDAIDLAQDGALILVAPGVYDELIWMYKPVRIQGWGPHGVTVNARKSPAKKLQDWRNKLNVELLAGTEATDDDQFCIIDGQLPLAFNSANNEPELFQFTEGAGITVAGDCGQNGQSAWTAGQARIDGFAITSADSAGAIFAAQHANNLVISNNRLINNFGTYGGGIIIGNHNLIVNNEIVDSVNHNITIHHNQIIENGGADGVGGGISMYTDTDNYVITNNYVCGNFTQGQGGGIGHLGLNPGGIIHNNTILLNQSFAQAREVSGGGIFIGGIRLPSPVAGEPPLLSVGTGDVTIRENLIQSNQSGAGNGGGVRLEFINGEDVVTNPGNNTQWYQVDLLNNMIVNNVAGLAGAGISVQDALRVRVYNDTVANNDSTATTISAFQAAASINLTSRQPSGIVSNVHSGRLADLANAPTNATVGDFSNLDIQNSIVWHNRSFCWGATAFDPQGFPTMFGLMLASNPICGGSSDYEDLAVLPRGSGFLLNPLTSDLTDITAYPGGIGILANLSVDPKFIQGYFLTDAGQTINQPETTIPQTTAAFDEGGNFIDARFGPLEPTGNYHLDDASPLINAGSDSTIAALSFNGSAIDFDLQSRPNGSALDIGADEFGQDEDDTGGLDNDNDGVPDSSDNCINIENPDQEETDGDIFGDACDGDFNNDGQVDLMDFSVFLGLLGQPGPRGDFNRSGTVDLGDHSILLGLIGDAPGPSGL